MKGKVKSAILVLVAMLIGVVCFAAVGCGDDGKDGKKPAGSAAGTKDNPIAIESNEFSVKVAAGKTVYYSFYAKTAADYELSSESTNVKLKCYDTAAPEQALEEQSTENGFVLNVSTVALHYYSLEFSTKDGKAATYTVKLTEQSEDAEGTLENPIAINAFRTYSATTTAGSDEVGGTTAQPVYYSYKVPENGITLYFKAGDNTLLQIWYVTADNVPVQRAVSEEHNDIPDGWALAGNLDLIIEVSNADGNAGPVSFTMSNTPLENVPQGSEENPYIINALKTYYDTTREGQDFFGNAYVEPVYYLYTVPNDMTLYFKAGDNTQVAASYFDEDFVVYQNVVSAEQNTMPDGWALDAGTELKIEVTNLNGVAGDVSFTMSATPLDDVPLGTEENPYVIFMFKTYYDTTTMVPGEMPGRYDQQPLVYSYTVPSDMTLYFAVDEYTELTVTYVGDNDVPITKTLNEYENELYVEGWAVTAGMVLKIEVSHVNWEAGDVSFTISNTSLAPAEGSEGNPFVIDEIDGPTTFTKTTTEGTHPMFGTPYVLPVYFTFEATEETTLYFKAGANTNISVTYYDSETDTSYTKVLNAYEDELSGGILLPAGTVITIELTNADDTAGPVSFTVSNAAIAD